MPRVPESTAQVPPAPPFSPGDLVRLIHNPGRIGTVTRMGCRVAGGTLQVQIAFADGVASWMRCTLVEGLPNTTDPDNEFRAGSTHDCTSLRRLLMHEKLGGRLADVLYSMEASDTRFLPYQFKPVLKLIESPCSSLLIADEVGLGKTIEAGLIWTELRARAGAQRLLVVCPAKLKEKWRRELARRFGTRAEVGGAQELLHHLKELRRNPSHGFALIASYHSLRPPVGWEETRPETNVSAELAHLLSDAAQADSLFDLLVMDEAHYMRNSKTQTFELGELATDVSANRVFLSATPLHTSNTNLYNLLRLLDPDTFSSEHAFKGILEANAPLVRLRDALVNRRSSIDEIRGHLDDAASNSYLTESAMLAALRDTILKPGALNSIADRTAMAFHAERINLIGHAVSRTRKRDVFTNEERVFRDVKARRVAMTTSERAVYDTVTDLAIEFSVTQDLPIGFLSVTPQRLVSSSIYAALEHWTAPRRGRLTDFTEEDEPHQPFVEFLRGRLGGRFHLKRLRSDDSKFQLLYEELTEYWRLHPGKKIILFSTFHPTIDYLRARLEEMRISSLVIKGGSSMAPQEVLDDFARPDGPKLLLSTEVGGEGLDMQFAATLINYDLPWNPMVVEQRIGRIDRIGQEERRILILNLLHKDTIDERIYDRLFLRLDLFRNSLGEHESVVGPVLEEMQRALVSHHLNPAEEEEIFQTAEMAIESERQTRERLEESASILAAYGDYIRNQIQAKHEQEQWVTAEEIEHYVCGYFHNYASKTRLLGIDAATRTYEIQLDLEAFADFDQFLGLNNLRGHTRVCSSSPTRIRFDHRLFAKAPAGVELVSQSHPLVRFVADQMRHRRIVQCAPFALSVSSAALRAQVSSGLYLFNVQRWDISGLRQFSKLRFDACPLSSDHPIEEASAQSIIEGTARLGQAWPAWQGDHEADSLLPKLTALDDFASAAFADFETRCMAENQDRARVQLTSLSRFEERRQETITALIQRHIARGNQPLRAAEEGKLAKLRERCELQRRSIEQRAETNAACTRLCFGIILIE